MSKPLFKAKILKPTRLGPNKPELLPGEVVEVDNNTLGGLISRGEAEGVVAAPAKPEKESGKKSGPTVKELKATLDELGVNYGANATKAELEALVKEAEKPEEGTDLLG